MLAHAPHFLPQHSSSSPSPSISALPSDNLVPPSVRPRAMSSPGIHPTPDKPPAATTGSPGTAIFLPPAAQSSRSLVATRSSASTVHLPPRPLSPASAAQRDRVPVQWSFESSYGLFGSSGGTALAPTRTAPKPRREGSGMLGGSWFGRKKDRDKDAKGKGKAKALSVGRPRSVDVEARALRPGSSSAPPAHVVTPPPSPDTHPQPLAARDLPPIPRISTSTPSRPARSHLRPATAHSTPSPPMPKSPESSTRVSPNLTPSPPTLTPPHIPSAPLPPIPASNTPTPRASRSPSPVPGSSSHPPPSFRPTSAHRPGSSAGFKAGRPAEPHTPHVSKSEPHQEAGRQRRRPATSSGIPATQDPTLFLGASLGVYGAGTPFSLSAAKGSKTSLAPSSTYSHSPEKTGRAEAAMRRRKELRERGFAMKGGKRHHPRAKEDAPYPRDYERKVLDHDVWEHSFARQLANSVTFHSFATPPAKVLDLGCGTGTWILDCARQWKDTHFVGLDLVPIQVNLARLGPADLAGRVRWVLGNFLERLPFADEEFDFVHVKRVARGVPEDRWDALFEEITRVLKKGGAFEMIEEDLFFPGSVTSARDDEEEGRGGEEEREEPTQLPPTPPRTAPSPHPPDPKVDVSLEPKVSDSTLRNEKALRRSNSDRSSTLASRRYSPSFLPDTRSRSSSETPPTSDIFTNSSSSRPANPTPTHAQAVAPRMSLDSWHTRGHTVASVWAPHQAEEGDQELFHPSTNPVTNPRDHSVLESAYVEMHAARFINLTPLSVLNLALDSHFKDVRSHTPIQLAFPPPAGRRQSASSENSSRATSLERRPSEETAPKQLKQSNLYDSSQRYVTLDTLRALGPKSSRLSQSRLPNQTWHFDIQALNMHLSARVVEVLACAEEMWEFIAECRRSSVARRNSALMALAAVSREDWEDCLARFEMDMHDKVGLVPAMNERLAWSVRSTPRTPERKAFDEAIEKWEKQQRRREEKVGKKGLKARQARKGQPLSRTLRAFVAWKG